MDDTLIAFAASLGIGLLIGLERERSPAAKAGVRTFALIAGALSGAEVAAMDEAALARAVRRVNVFARVRPEQKLRRFLTKIDSDFRTAVRKVKKSGFARKDIYEKK